MNPQLVHEFWFGDVSDPLACVERNYERWFKSGAALDASVRERFATWVDAAGRDELDHWMRAPRDALSLIITLDQFPRHLHRGSARAFELDPKALQMCRLGVEQGLDQALSPVERGFFYLPLEHAEDLAAQQQGVALMHANTRSGPPALREYLENAAHYGEIHRDLIARFGRFPHRNEALGRASSEAEVAYLRDGGHRFGQ